MNKEVAIELRRRLQIKGALRFEGITKPLGSFNPVWAQVHYWVELAQLSWRTYNSYLKTNHIATGVENYNEVTRLYLGIPLDANGLPNPR